MGILNYQTFHVFVAQEFEKVTEPTGMVRRIGVSEYATEVRHYIQKDLDAVDSLITEGRLSLEKASKSVTDLVLEITSFLYAAGAEHHVWRRWSSLTGLGMFLTGEIQEAAQYAVLGGEWDFLKVLPSVPVQSKQISEQVLWMLVKGKPVPNLPESASDDEDNAWLQLAKSIPAQDHRKTEDALKLLADFWMAEDEGDWMNFHPRSYPDFETPACAVAAIARHHGFTPTSLTPDQYRFLEPGLARSEPPPLFPNYFSLPASQKE
jgi:hypothetical protein